ncbi:glutamate decarboxylase [Clostridium perfringens]|uniref:Glutamate decarboxylase n=2 Tax=Clostridium perfringens TaxID=1502 RepID=A0A2X2XP57_CLOPF|nr:glutamate decarboxylase [Clostridium perfringens]ALG49661.1 Glutamate decarboxylase [Clostridium perfringens]AXH53259.1 glutamate decarboxylase [Clostridium perfringens]EDS80418.1 glutamate decarboxylase [Clostridium perfringens C str. JGS1495]EHK2387777.1 glutamate decarboxylase [Clostridium perfringens]EHK2404519.1 glutamate decarboxylase [Clostridium perfringens]
MLFGKNELGSQFETPIFGTVESNESIPKYELAKKSIAPQVAYRLIKDDLLDEGNARQNLCTFCQTYMDDEAVKLMAETLEKNAIDKSEYPQTTDLENRCVNILADLWHAPKDESFMGTSTVGSSEACMLGGMAMKFRWRNRAKALGMDVTSRKPNLVISSGYQVCWEKFCVYWDIEMRLVPMDEEHMSINVDKVLDYVDDYTIGVVGILGITYTGKYDDIKALDKKLEEYNKTAKLTVPMHIDAASGGMFAPFIEPELEWDFRLKNVVSISTSGHKYGLVYPGIGWVLWRDKEYLPQELVFDVSYLGGKIPTMAINFSRSASQIIGQYYNFLRYGFEGYRQIHQRTKDVAMFLASELEKTGLFQIYNNGENLPIVCYKLRDDINVDWTLYDLADRLLMKGWQVPAYPLPADLQDTIIQRIVCRADLSHNLAELYLRDLKAAIEDLNNARVLNQKSKTGVQGFTH